MSDNYLSLDWRNGPPPKEIIHRLEQVFTDVDDKTKSGTTLCLSQSTAKKAYSVMEKNGHPIVMRHDNSSHRAYSGQVKFWSGAYTIAVSLVDMQAQEQMLKIRFIQYREVFPNTSMTLDQVKRILTDLALTIKVHPLALGVLAEDRGKFYLPDGVLIDATIISNVISHHKTNGSGEFTKKKTFKHEQGTAMTIPQLVEKLMVRIQNKRSVRAVIVTEHANLSTLLMDAQFDINNCIVITLMGYPGYSTCEWIRMLSIDPLLEQLPWLMLIDHDFQGVHIFSKVKYGCRSSAWVSEISVCSQLQCIGPFRDGLTQSPALYRPDWEAQYRADHPRKDDKAVAKAADEWEARCGRKIMRKFTAASATDKSLHKSFERTGWLEYEPALKEELRIMLRQRKRPTRWRFGSLRDALQLEKSSSRFLVKFRTLALLPRRRRRSKFGDGVFTQTFVGGYTWRFTGNLAGAEFRDALAGKLADEKAQEEVPTRQQPDRKSKGNKAAKKIPDKQRRLKRVQQRSTARDETLDSPERMVEQEDAIEQPEPSSPFDFSSEPELDEESDGSSAPIEGLLDKRTTEDGEVEYEVQWAGPYNTKTTWEPASHVQAVSIAEFEEKNNAGKTKRGRGRPPKKKQTKTSTANAPRTRSAGKVAKKSAK